MAPNFVGHSRNGFVGIMLIEEPVVDLDDSVSSNDFHDCEALGEGFDLGLRKSSSLCWIIWALDARGW